MKTLLSMMRQFHYLIGVTAPAKENERMVLLIWIGIAVATLAVGILFTLFIVPRILG